MGDKGSVMLVGSYRGDSAKSNQGGEDFAAVKLNTLDGSILYTLSHVVLTSPNCHVFHHFFLHFWY